MGKKSNKEKEDKVIKKVSSKKDNETIVLDTSLVNDLSKEIGNKSNKKKLSKKKLFLIIILSLIVIVTFYFVILDVINSSYLPPDNVVYKSYNYDGFVVSCTVDGKNINDIIEKDDILRCYLHYDLYSKDEYNVKELYYNLEYGSNLKYLGFEEKGENHAYHMKNNYKIIFDKAENRSSDFSKVHKFRVLKKGDYDSTYVRMNNIVFKNNDGKYYKALDSSMNFNFNGDVRYIYKNNYTVKVLNYEDISNTSYLQGTYSCKSKDCKYLSYDGDFVFFDDESLVVYNYVDDYSITLDKELLGYKNYSVVKDDEKIYGLIFDNEDDKSGYYSIESKKIVLEASYDYMYDNDIEQVIYFNKDEKLGIYDLRTDKLALKAEYDNINCYEYDDNFCLVEKNGKTNVFDRNVGKTLLNENEIDKIKCYDDIPFMCIITKGDKKRLYAPYINEIDSTKLYNHVIVDKYGKGDAVYTLFGDDQVITYKYITEVEDLVYSNPSTYSTKYFYESETCGDAYYAVDVDKNIISLYGHCSIDPTNTSVNKELFIKEDNYNISYDDINMYVDSYEDKLYIDLHLTGSNGSSIDKSFVYDLKTKKLSEIKEDMR